MTLEAENRMTYTYDTILFFFFQEIELWQYVDGKVNSQQRQVPWWICGPTKSCTTCRFGYNHDSQVETN